MYLNIQRYETCEQCIECCLHIRFITKYKMSLSLSHYRTSLCFYTWKPYKKSYQLKTIFTNIRCWTFYNRFHKLQTTNKHLFSCIQNERDKWIWLFFVKIINIVLIILYNSTFKRDGWSWLFLDKINILASEIKIFLQR